MKSFWSYVSNGKYAVGCTGGTVYVYDNAGNELAKFKDIRYAYHAAFVPGKNIIVVKSTEARLAIYSLDEMKLIKKMKFSKLDYAQDGGYCFSADGKYFYNVESHTECSYDIAIYETDTFRCVKKILEDEEMVPKMLECGKNGEIYVIGFIRIYDSITVDDEDATFTNSYFIAKLPNDMLDEKYEIIEDVCDFYHTYKGLELEGFTKKAKEWSGFKYKNVDMTDIENWNISLEQLWEKRKEKGKMFDLCDIGVGGKYEVF